MEGQRPSYRRSRLRADFHSMYLPVFGKRTRRGECAVQMLHTYEPWPATSFGREVEPRTTRLVLNGGGEVTTLPCSRWIKRRIARRPFSTIGCLTVVSGGLVHAAIGRSSYPITDRSAGTCIPAASAAPMTPIAAISLIARIAVGRRLPFGNDSKARAPAAIVAPEVTRYGSATPAPANAAW